MNALTILIFCLAFIIGTFASVLPLPMWGLILTVFGLGLLIGLVVPALWKRGPKRWVWLLAGLIACFACAYIQFRTPQPQPNDISTFAPATEVKVRGTVIDASSITRSGRAKFLLDAKEIEIQKAKPQSVSGKLYTTIPLIQATGLRPGQSVKILGALYKPKAGDNPGAFDFKLFLARRGVFAGLSGWQMDLQGDPPKAWGWWLRKRVAHAHVQGVGMPQGALLTSIALGNRAVDLPEDIKDTFIQVGLAAVLAASGFQVSLLLEGVLLLSRNISPVQKMIRGSIFLIMYLVLTGASPSVLRAVLMGLGGLVGLVMERRGRPLVGLAIVAVSLLLYEPLWIWDLGFQFSFLATLGLIVTVEPITQRLSRLPPLLATALAVPIAAYIWTLPLQLYVFGKLSIYSIFANVLTTPLISFATIGGMVSGLFGIVYIPLGAIVSWFMLTPLTWVIAIANWIHTLPGAKTNAGTISLWQMLLVYGIFLLIWFHPWQPTPKPEDQKTNHPPLPSSSFHLITPSRLLTAIALVILFVPSTIARSSLLQATFFADERSPVMFIQNQGTNALINSGDQQLVEFNLLPFLQKSGVNRIDWAIATDPQLEFSEGWQSIAKSAIAISNFWDIGAGSAPKAYKELKETLSTANTKVGALAVGQPLKLSENMEIYPLNATPGVLRIQIADTTWLFLANADLKAQNQLLAATQPPDPNDPFNPIDPNNQAAMKPKLDIAKFKADILWWNGNDLLPALMDIIKPKIAIASTTILPDTLVKQFKDNQIRLYWTGRDGAILWTAQNDIQTLRDRSDNNSPL